MKRKFTFLLAALLLMSGLTWAQQITWTAKDQGYENGQVIENVDFNDFVAGEFFKGTNANNAPKYYSSGEAIRCYGGNYFTITSDYVLTEIALGFGSGDGSNAITTDVGTYENGTWTGSANEVTFTIGGTSGNRRITTFTITYDEGGSPAPSIGADDVEIAYDATEGAIEYTINNGVADGALTASTTAQWLTLGIVGTTVLFTCTANLTAAARTATVILTYTYNTDQIVTKSITLTQAGDPNVINNISDITAAGTYSVQGTIVAKSMRGFIVGDGTGYVYYYNQNYDQAEYEIGDNVRLAGPVVVYGGVFEFNSSTNITYVEESNYVAEEPIELSGADMDARVASTTPPQLSNYVQYEGTLTVSGTHYNITNIAGATTATGSISYPLDTEFVSLNGKHVKVSGYYVGISSSTYYNTIIGSVEEVVSTEPSITVTPTTVNFAATAAEGFQIENLTIAYNNIEVTNFQSFTVQFYDNQGNETEMSTWLIAGVTGTNDEGYVVRCVAGNNDGEARTVYFKVYAYDADNNKVYSELVTVNQAEYVAPTYAELPFAFNSGRDAIEDIDGLSQNGLGTDYNANTNPNTQLKFDGTDDWLLLQFNDRPGTLTFDIKGNSFSGGTFTVQTSENGTTYTDLATYTELTSTVLNEEFTDLGENVRYIKWIYTAKGSGNVGLGNIALGLPDNTPYITVTPATVNVDAGQHLVNYLDLTYNNIEVAVPQDFTVHYYNAEDEEIELVQGETWMIAGVVRENDVYQVLYTIIANEGEARTAYFRVSCGETYSNLVTVNQEAYVAPPVDYAELPFEFNGGCADIESTDGLTAEGLGSDYSATTNPNTKLKFDGTGDWMILHFNEAPGTLMFDIKGNGFNGGTFTVQISEDGETYENLATYTELGDVNTKTFGDLDENVRYIKWVYTEKASGNVGLGNIHLYRVGGGPVFETYDLTVEPIENLEIFTFIDDELTEPMEGAGTIQVTEGVNVMLSVSAEPGYVMQSLMVDGVEHVNDIDDELTYTFVMPNHNVTISATAVEDVPFEPATYTLATSIESGKTYIIVGKKTIEGVDNYYAMGEQRNNNRRGVAINVAGTIATVETEDVYEFVITALEEDGFYSIYDDRTPGYLYAAAPGNNYLRTEPELDTLHNGDWAISIDGEGMFSIVASNSNNRNVMQFNYNGGNTLFTCYPSANQSPVYLYVKDETPGTVTQTIALAAGWNWVSFNVEVTLDDVKAALVESMPDLIVTIKSRNDGLTIFNGTRWRGTLNSLDVTQMYKIKVNTSCEITLEGRPINPVEHPITIRSGVNWIGFPFFQSMSLTDAFNSFAVNGDRVASSTQNSSYNGMYWRGQLTTLEPGQGYTYTSNQGEDRTFVFPASTK